MLDYEATDDDLLFCLSAWIEMKLNTLKNLPGCESLIHKLVTFETGLKHFIMAASG